MHQRSPFAAPILALFLAGFSLHAQAPLRAPTWQERMDLPGIDLSPLTVPQREAALKMMHDVGCTCGCNMKIAQCRVEDPNCGYSKGIATLIIRSFKEGKSPEEVAKIVAGSPLGKPRPQPKLLEDPVQIPTAGSPVKGPETARVVLVEFSDFECPYCAKATGEIRQIMAAYPKDLRLVYKQFPLSMHPHAGLASLASLAAQEQGKFWELHDQMFNHYRELSREHILAWAQELGMDMPKFTAAMDNPKYRTEIEKDMEDGQFAGVNGTPALYINGKHFNGPIALAVLKPILDDEIKNSHAASRP
jgi:protein-disulfide isomerase